MSRSASRPLVIRISPTDEKHLRKIRECGDWDNDSAAVRFCIDFTSALLSILPAALIENYVQASSEPQELPESPEPDLTLAGVVEVAQP